jgi:hypothetical protein
MLTDRSTRVFPVRRGYWIAWDLPAGPLHDPPEYAGRAALCARYLSARHLPTPGRVAAAAGWVQQHALRPDRSCFSYWSPEPPADTLEAMDRAASGVLAEAIEPLRRDQLALAERRRQDPVARLFQALHVAAWGEPAAAETLGTAESLAAVDAGALGDYLAANLGRSSRLALAGEQVVHRVRWDEQPAPAQPGTWREGTQLVSTPSRQYLVAVQYRFPAGTDEGALAVIGELLGTGAGGRLVTELRARRGLAYSTGAICRIEHGWPVLLAYATTGRAQLLECTRRLAALTGDFDQIDPGDWIAAGDRAQRRQEESTDAPFAQLDAHRRTARGLPPPATVGDLAVQRAEQFAAGAVARPLGGCARAAVGELDSVLASALAATW